MCLIYPVVLNHGIAHYYGETELGVSRLQKRDFIVFLILIPTFFVD